MAPDPSHRTSHALSLTVLALAIATLAGTATSLAVSDTGTDDHLDLLRTMAELDRAYIPALWWIGQQEREQAGAALDRLNAVWMGVETILADSPLLDEQAARDLGAVAASIAKASAFVRAGGSLHDAHQVLEEIRLRTLDLRSRNDLPYFLDRLTQYHEPMESIVLAATAGEEDTIPHIRELLPRARALWQAAEEHPFDNRVFHLEPHEVRRREQAMSAARAALDALEATLDTPAGGEGPTRTLEAARAIKPPFARLVLLFGGIHPGAGPDSPPRPSSGGGSV